MKLEFEKWLDSQNISGAVEDIFQEAVQCYKAGSYRAALLLSYVGFLSILRERILSADAPPTNISSGEWQHLVRDVKNDDKWESAIFRATQRQSPSIFDVSNDVRQQVLYWKNRRNDCAHSKRNIISNAHVEAFWQFVQSNLPKFVVRDSSDSLLNKIKMHFDRSVTPANKDSGYLIEQIPDAVDLNTLPDFLENVYTMLEGSSTISSAERRDFFARLLELDAIITEVITFLQTKEDLLVEILRAFPQHLLLFSNDAQFVRRLWYRHLFAGGRNDFALYCSLLRNRLIPPDQIAEAHRVVIRRMPDIWPQGECFALLEQTGFFDTFKGMVFNGERLADVFGWANYHTHVIIGYIAKFGIDDEIAQSLQEIFSKENYPYDLQGALELVFANSSELRDQMLQRLASLQLPVPRYLSALQSN